MGHQEESSLRYTGTYDSVPANERQELDSAFVEVMMMAEFDRDQPGEAGYGARKASPFSQHASAILRDTAAAVDKAKRQNDGSEA